MFETSMPWNIWNSLVEVVEWVVKTGNVGKVRGVVVVAVVVCVVVVVVVDVVVAVVVVLVPGVVGVVGMPENKISLHLIVERNLNNNILIILGMISILKVSIWRFPEWQEMDDWSLQMKKRLTR